jgi:hypothetical protein
MYRRCTAFVVLVLFVAGSVASTLHMALVRHEVCAEHGEVVHASGATLAPVDTDCGEHAPVLTSAPRDESGDAHEHCPIATKAQLRDFVWTPTFEVVRNDRVPTARACVPDAPRVSSVACLALAPKHSPPI